MSIDLKKVNWPWKRWRFWRFLTKLFLFVWAALAVTVVAAGVVLFVVFDQVLQPGVAGPAIQMTIPEGVSGREVGDLLTDAGLIEHEGFFRLAMRLDKKGGTIRHGLYELPKGLSATELLHRLYGGPARHLNINQFSVTIPEGLSIAQAAELFDDAKAFTKAASGKESITRLGIETSSLEGFLMPNTYFFDTEPSPAEVVERMVAQFEKEYGILVAERPGNDEFDVLSIVTVASLVEEEARADEERPMVAAVMYNRLEKGMPLQMDSTLQYATGKYGQRLLYEDREVDSPYNTYKNTGLPPGPISSPGVASIRAALQPANVDYLYFVSNADGKTHTFSSSARDHERAVAKYRREIARQRRDLRQ